MIEDGLISEHSVFDTPCRRATSSFSQPLQTIAVMLWKHIFE